MAALCRGGAEALTTTPDPGLTNGGTTPSIETATPISGRASWRYVGNGSGSSYIVATWTAASDVWFYGQFRFIFDDIPSTATEAQFIAAYSGGTSVMGWQLDQSGLTEMTGAGVHTVDNPITLSADVEYVAQVAVRRNSADSSWDYELLIDGETIYAGNRSGTGAQVPSVFRFGMTTTAVATMKWDDIIVNDSTGSANNALPDLEARIGLLVPVGDDAVGANWQLGNESAPSGNAWDSINNLPPTAKSNTNATDPDQIKNPTASTTQPAADADFDMEPWDDRMPAGATVTWARVVAEAASGSNTGMAGALRILSNPTEPGETAVGPTPNLSQGGVWPSNWSRWRGATQDSPTVTESVGPVVRVGKRTASAGPLMIALLGVMFEYVPDAGGGGPISANTSDTVTVADSAGAVGHVNVVSSDSLSITDMARRKKAQVRQTNDVKVIDDTALRSISMPRTSEDTVEIADAATRILSEVILVAASDSVGVSEALTRRVSLIRGLIEETVTIEQARPMIFTRLNTADSIAITDAAVRVVSRPRSASDSVAIADVLDEVLRLLYSGAVGGRFHRTRPGHAWDGHDGDAIAADAGSLPE